MNKRHDVHDVHREHPSITRADNTHDNCCFCVVVFCFVFFRETKDNFYMRSVSVKPMMQD